MENSQTRDVGASATALGQEVRINAKVLLHLNPRIPLSWYVPYTGWSWRWSYIATLVPTRWILHLSFILCSDLTHSQMEAEIDVAREIEREQESEEAETEVKKCQTHVLPFVLRSTISFLYLTNNLFVQV